MDKNLPIYQIAGQVNEALAQNRILTVTAPPGAGKSTVLPLTILKGLNPDGKIILLEPRRLAARQVAERMAESLDEAIGETVGYRIRFESKVSQRTRIEVVTEGILSRMMVNDPTLEDVSVLIFDEFHERNINSDFALALARMTQNIIREDLKILIMSATIDADFICKSLASPLIKSEGRMFPVQVHYCDQKKCIANDFSVNTVAQCVAECINDVVTQTENSEEAGDILAFLPGEAEIRRCADIINGIGERTGINIMPLYGMLSPSEQKAAISASRHGNRKIVLATPIAETSLTIKGIRTVIDSGLCKKSIFNSQTSMSRLETVRISKDMAIQRMGRAGRTASGNCFRLWTPATEAQMQENRTPEILESDLCSMLLDIAVWGNGQADELPWLTPPPSARLKQGMELLISLGAIDSQGQSTEHGIELQKMPCHPRVAQMLISAVQSGNNDYPALACDIAALLDEKDFMYDRGCDLEDRVNALRDSRRTNSITSLKRINRISEQYLHLCRSTSVNASVDSHSIGALMACAYPERIGKQLSTGHFLLSNGETVSMDISDSLSTYPWIVVASMNSRPGAEGKVFLAAAVSEEDLMPLVRTIDNISWDSKEGKLISRQESRLGKLVLQSKPLSHISTEDVERVICEAVMKEGHSMLDISDEVEQLQRRIRAVSQWHPELNLPDISSDAVIGRCSEWLPMYLGTSRSRSEIRRIDMVKVLWSMLDYEQQLAVERIAPSHIMVPTGIRIKVDYRLGAEAPVLKVRLQECFGMSVTPRVDNGRIPVLMELLSPGFKPVQLTQDLASFWSNTYFEVRKELKRRYPKHSWPDNPLEVEAVRGVRKKQ